MVIPHADKIAHAIAFAGLMIWFGALVPQRNYPHLFVAFVAYGGIIELMQNLTGYRTMDLADLVADTAGLLLGWLLLLLGCDRWPRVFEARFKRS